ncbi:ribose-5-phosphate isomerase RpiA [Lentibacillus sp. L22]|uniref:ribose-5-phosphate isomerase RpiA n=1 Tax=Lentibacillus TaxID=175304 RepID=UPI0022B19B81|nr:ribose-5-phosphate isomerase RpiA [Lentibacillus daqui]
MNQTDLHKMHVGEKAVTYIKDGMTVGLGSGSTVNWMLKKLGERVQEGLTMKGIPTSTKTEKLAKAYGIPLTSFAEIDRIDLAIDGADEVDENLNLIKGGGGSLLREKIVDARAKQLLIIVDESKQVTRLGKFPLPIEVVPFGWEMVAKEIANLGGKPQLRKLGNDIFVSDNGNYILDCAFNEIDRPGQLHNQLKALTGVVETGLFINMADQVITATEKGIKIS